MADLPGGADARVVITIDVNDAQANAKLAALGQRLRALDKDSKTSSRSLETVGDKLDDVSKGATRSSKSLKDMGDGMTRMTRAMRAFSNNAKSVGKALSVMGSAFGALFKIVAVGAIEFGLLTAAVGAFKLALVSAQYIAKAWTGIVQGVGAAAGVAVAGIASVFAALRELQVAQMAPMYTGAATAKGDIGRILGSKQLAIFDQQSLQGIVQQQLASTGRLDPQFQQRLTRLANFTGGDAKSLQNLNQLFNDMQKSGKVTADLYAQLQSSSPALAKAFQEMAGGEKQAIAAAASGSVSFQKFFDAVMKGELEALRPYNDALERINDTLIGRLKGSLISIREQLTDVGDSLLSSLKGPIAEVEEAFSNFLFAVAPTLQRVFPRLIGDAFGAGNNVLDRFLMRVAVLINENMPKLIGFGSQLRDIWNSFRDALSVVGAYLERMSAGWTTVWNSVLKPFFTELGKTFNFALDEFNRLIADNADELDRMGKSLAGAFEVFRGLISALSIVKEILQPFMQGLLTIMSVIGGAMTGGGMLGAFMRITAAIGILSLAFVKFTSKLAGFIVKVMSGETSLQKLASRQSEAANTANANAVAQNKQQSELSQTASAANATAAAINNLTAAQQRNAAVTMGGGRAAIPSYGGPNAGGYTYAAGQAAMYGPGPRELAQANAQRMLIRDPKTGMFRQAPAHMRLDMWDPRRNALRGALAARAGGGRAAYDAMLMQQAVANSGGVATGGTAFGRAGSLMAKAFSNDAVKKYGVGSGMAATFVGALVQGSSASTSTTGQGLGGALAGAGTGAMIGSMFGPGGTLVGGAIGGLVGGLTGIMGARAEQERQREEERARLDARIEELRGTGGLFNRRSDFVVARMAFSEQLGMLQQGRLAQSAADSAAAAGAPGRRFAPFLSQLGISVRDGQFVDSATGTALRGNELIEGATSEAQRFLTSQGFDPGDVSEAIARYGVQGAFAELAGVDLSNLEDAADELYEASGALGEYNESIARTTQELQKIIAEEAKYTGKLESAQRILGMSGSGVISLFERMNLSLTETGVNISVLNEALGYTGDVIVDLGVATARLRDALFDPVNTLRTEAEMDDKLRSTLTAFFETRGNQNLSTNEMKTLAADTVGTYVDAQLAKIASGETSFVDMFGAGGDFMAGFNELWDQAIAGGVPPELRGMVTDLIAEMVPTFSEALTDPFKRMQYDPEFAAGFTKQIEQITGGAYGAIRGGASVDEVIAAGTTELVSFLEESGFEISDQTLIDLETLLGNSLLDSAAGIADAFEEGSKTAYDAIVAALNNRPFPGGAGTGSEREERGYNFPTAVSPAGSSRSSASYVTGDTNITINIPPGTSDQMIQMMIDEAIKERDRELLERGFVGVY